MSRTFFRGKQTIIPSCICNDNFDSGGFKTAHNINCSKQNGTCYPQLNEYKNDEYVALSIRDKKGSNGIKNPISEQWKDITYEIERQMQFFDKDIAVNIPMVILEYSDNQLDFIKKDEFTTKLYEKNDSPPNLSRVVLIMQRIKLPGPDFDAIGLAEKLVENGVLSGDFKSANAGTITINGIEKTVLIDWDPKFQVLFEKKDVDDEKKKYLVCYMIIIFLTNLLDDILYWCPISELKNEIKLFDFVRAQLIKKNPEMFENDKNGLIELVKCINTSEFFFREKKQHMIQNLYNYTPIRKLFPNRQTTFEKDIHSLIQINIEDLILKKKGNIQEIIKEYLIEIQPELQPKLARGGSRKRQNIKRIRPYRKKNRTKKYLHP